MRSQVLTDIAVTTATPSGASGVSTSPASFSVKQSDGIVYRDGLSFRVRVRPPSYFAEQSRLEEQARREYGLLRGRQRELPARRGFKKQVRLSPADATSRHLLGLWFYEVAGLSWAMRKVAAALFAQPPTVSQKEGKRKKTPASGAGGGMKREETRASGVGRARALLRGQSRRRRRRAEPHAKAWHSP
jgi:hypothetical protein